MSYPFTEVAGGMLPPVQHDLVVRIRVLFEESKWSVGKVIDVDSEATPREVVETQIEALNERYRMRWDAEDFVLQANEAPGVVLESLECPGQKIADYPWVTTKLMNNQPVEVKLVKFKAFSKTFRQSSTLAALRLTAETCLTTTETATAMSRTNSPVIEKITMSPPREEEPQPPPLPVDTTREDIQKMLSQFMDTIHVQMKKLSTTVDEKISEFQTRIAALDTSPTLSKLKKIQDLVVRLNEVKAVQDLRETVLQERVKGFESKVEGVGELEEWVRVKVGMMGRFLHDYTEHSNEKVDIFKSLAGTAAAMENHNKPERVIVAEVGQTTDPVPAPPRPPVSLRSTPPQSRHPPTLFPPPNFTQLESDLITEQSWAISMTKEAVISHREGIPSRRSDELFMEYYRLMEEADGGKAETTTLSGRPVPAQCPGYKQDWSKPVCLNCGATRAKCNAKKKR